MCTSQRTRYRASKIEGMSFLKVSRNLEAEGESKADINDGCHSCSLASSFSLFVSFCQALISEHTWTVSEVNCGTLPAMVSVGTEDQFHAGHIGTTEADMLVSFSLTHRSGIPALGYV